MARRLRGHLVSLLTYSPFITTKGVHVHQVISLDLSEFTSLSEWDLLGM
jgi:hypothetical protein